MIYLNFMEFYMLNPVGITSMIAKRLTDSCLAIFFVRGVCCHGSMQKSVVLIRGYGAKLLCKHQWLLLSLRLHGVFL